MDESVVALAIFVLSSLEFALFVTGTVQQIKDRLGIWCLTIIPDDLKKANRQKNRSKKSK